MRRLAPVLIVCTLMIAAFPGVGSSAPPAPPEAACPSPADTLHAVVCAGIKPVPSLAPSETDAAWHRLAHGHQTLAGTVTSDCRTLRAVFYTATDWRRLATKLAGNASACAQYYISIPPLSADKTQERSDEAWRIRALGSNFHALAEINMSAWATWVADNGGTWYSAGVEARRRMAAAGYDVSLGDTWAVNEFSSAVRQGAGTARTDARDLVHGLFDGDGTAPTARGAVFTVGIGQGTTSLSTYKTNLENWLQDSAFWTAMNAYVSDWAQEVYGDFRNYGVAGSGLPTRRDYLTDYLQHELVLAGAGPDTIASARSYLQATYSPLASAAWQWTSGFGWTSVPVEQMEDYVSAQTYALRYFSGTTAQSQDHWGYAWAPNNSTGMASTDFTTQTGAILDRLAAAIHDSAQPLDASDPGIGACGPLGQNLWCAGDIAGASFNDGWKTFRFWQQPALAFTTAPQTLTAGSASSAMTVQLQNGSGTPVNTASNATVTLASSSAQGSFSTSSSGPWSTTLNLTIAQGTSTTPSFFYEDTKAGSPTLTVSGSGTTSGSQTETVNAAALASITVSPGSATLAAGATQVFTAGGVDGYGNPVDVSNASWAVSPSSLGSVSPGPSSTTTFTAGAAAGSGSVIASVGAVQGSASVSVSSAGASNSPTNLSAVPATGKGVQLSWTAPSSAVSSYRLYRRTGVSGSFGLVSSINGATTYKDTTTTRGVTYYYYATAVNSAGESAPSNTAGPVVAK